MSKFQIYDNKFLIGSDGKFARHEDCCCEAGETICDIDTSDDLDVTFADIADCPTPGDCDTDLNGNTFRVTFFLTVGNIDYWRYNGGAGGELVQVYRNCVTNKINVISYTNFGEPSQVCFQSGDVDIENMPQNINNDSDCLDAGTYGYNGTAQVSKA